MNLNVCLNQSTLQIDLKGSVKNEIEEALENKPVLRASIGHLLSIFAPLHVHLSDIDSVKIEKAGVRIHLPRHRDIIVPLEAKEAKKLVQMLKKLTPEEKDRELKRSIEERKLGKIAEEERELEAEFEPLSGNPIPEPLGVREKEEEEKEK